MASSSPWLKNCCFCIHLQVGSCVLGIALAILKMVEIIQAAFHFMLLGLLTGSFSSTNVQIGLIIYIVGKSLHLITNICLLVALMKDKPKYMGKFLVVYLIFVALDILLFLATLSLYIENVSQIDPRYKSTALFWIPGILILFLIGVTIILEIHWMLVVKSWSIRLKEKLVEDRGVVLKVRRTNEDHC